MKALHSVFYILIFFYLLRVLYNGFPKKASVFFRQMKKIFDSAKQREKQGYFQKRLPLIVNGSEYALLPFRCGLSLIVNGSGMRASSPPSGLPLIVNGSGMCASALPVRTSVNR